MALNSHKNRFIRGLKYVRSEEFHNVVTERKVQEIKFSLLFKRYSLFNKTNESELEYPFYQNASDQVHIRYQQKFLLQKP